MRKKILAVIICIFSIFLFCGCANVNYSITVESTGIVTQALNLSFNRADVVNAGKTLNSFMQSIENIANQVVQTAYNDFTGSHQLDEDLTTYSGDTVKFAQIIEFVNQNLDPNNGKPKIEWDWDNTTVYCKISLRFLNIYAYRYFYDSYPDSEEEDTTVREDHFYYAKDIDYSDSPYNDITNNSIAQYFMDYFENQFSYDDVNFSFTYSTPNSKIYSDANLVEEDTNGNTVHTWTFTTEQITQDGKSKVALYTIKYRAYVWYVTAIAASVFVGLALLFVCKIKELRQAKPQSNSAGDDLAYFQKTSKEIVEANKRDKENDNQ